MTAGGHPRGTSRQAELARLGFADPQAAERLLGGDTLRLLDRPGTRTVLEALGRAADPGLALAALERLVAAADRPTELLEALQVRDGLQARLLGVLGASVALGNHLARHPLEWYTLGDDDLPLIRPTRLGLEHALAPALTAARPLDALRVAYRTWLLRLAARDLSGEVAVEDVAGELADLAGATLETALALARAQQPAGAAPCRLAVIGMGKCGGRELNYVSDVDVVFVAEPADGAGETAALAAAGQLAAALMRICSATTAEGTIWPVDAALRPEGRAGPLVRTLASHESYYRRWAQTWEFQALLKARPVAGDRELGHAYVERLEPLVWNAAQRKDFVPDVQAMRRRVEAQLPRASAEREIKLGPGGLRDVEFAVQLLQLVHGRSDPSLRSGTTLVALDALARGGYVGRGDAERLDAAYRFLRMVEHRLQLYRLRRTHTLPTAAADLERLSRSLGYRGDAVAAFEADRRSHTLAVRQLHRKLFYRPLLDSVARLPPDEARLTAEAAIARLTALGFAEPAVALRHLQALTAGVSRRAAIQQTLLPVMLEWFADAADPDAGLLSFRQVSEALGSTPWYLRLLRDEGQVAERLARLLATSRYVADLLGRAPEGVALLAGADALRPRPAEALTAELLAAVGRKDDWEGAVATARGLRRRELLRVACADLLGELDVDTVGGAITDVTTATLVAALATATRKIEAERRAELPVRLLVVAMGRLGGREQGYGSDADVLFVHEPVRGVPEQVAGRAAHEVFEEMRRLLALPAPDPALGVDAGLRPEGRQGPLTRSLDSYAGYYRRWSLGWEAQALLRAAPVAGDRDLGERFLALVDPIRWPTRGVDDAGVREIRRIKARVETERLPRSADPSLHMKLGPGGLADVEWTAQLLQLRHAAEVPALRTPRTLPALTAAANAGLLAPADGATLAAAWRLATRVRNAVMLVRGRPGDSLPADPRERAAVARAVGYPAGHAGDLLEDYRRTTRRARAVVERVFYA